MAKKKIITAEDAVQPETVPVTEPAVVVDAVVEVPEPPKPAPQVQAEPEHTQAPKKRIRIRKKAAKHVSVAVLCANPTTRRFI